VAGTPYASRDASYAREIRSLTATKDGAGGRLSYPRPRDLAKNTPDEGASAVGQGMPSTSVVKNPLSGLIWLA